MSGKEFYAFFIAILVIAGVYFGPNLLRSSSHIEVSDCIELQAIGSDSGDYVGWTLDADYVLIDNIDCSDTVNWNGGEGFIPIGGPNELVFTGSLDGQNFTINDLFIECDLCDGLGLFAITLGATFQNINFEGGSITATNTNFAGALVGMADGGTTISNVSSNIPITVDGGHVGGLVGSIEPGGSITNSFSTGNITNETGPAGGLVGGIYGSTIDNSCSTSDIVAGDPFITDVGGLVGYARESIITRSYATGVINAYWYGGGLVGQFEGAFGLEEDYYISESYASGSVISNAGDAGEGYSGGLVGYLNLATINNSYAIGGVDSPFGYGIGGLVGYSRGNATINNSYATGTTSGVDWVGGLLGYAENLAATGVEINNSYSATDIDSVGSEIGGLAGYLENVGVVLNSFFDFIRSGEITECVGVGDGTGCTAVNTLDIPNTNYFFGNDTNPPLDTWDFDTIWMTQNETYPILRTFGTIGGSCGPQILGSSDPNPSVTISANPSSITEGESTTISWTSTETTSCSASWTGSTATSGSEEVSPTTTTEYSITCVNGAFSDEDSITVTVSSVPQIEETSGGSTSSRRRSIEEDFPQEENEVFPPIISTAPPAPPAPTPIPSQPQETPTEDIDDENIESFDEEIEQQENLNEENILPIIQKDFTDRTTEETAGLSFEELAVFLSSALVFAGTIITALQFSVVPESFSVTNIAKRINAVGILSGSKRKRNYWGTVYDSETKEPLDPVLVTLLSQDENKTIASAVTDLDGRYGFLAPPGIYKIKVEKTNYEFPSKKMSGKERDIIYENLYFGQEILIGEGAPLITRDIPMDAMGFDWNQAEKRSKGVTNFYSKHDIFFQKFANVIIALGLIWSLAALYMNQTSMNLLILLGYVAVIVMRSLAKPQKYGKVFDDRGEILKYALIKVFQASTNVEVRHTVTDHMGRYFCLVPNGEYYIKIEKRVGPETFEQVLVSNKIKVKNGILKETFIA